MCNSQLRFTWIRKTNWFEKWPDQQSVFEYMFEHIRIKFTNHILVLIWYKFQFNWFVCPVCWHSFCEQNSSSNMLHPVWKTISFAEERRRSPGKQAKESVIEMMLRTQKIKTWAFPNQDYYALIFSSLSPNFFRTKIIQKFTSKTFFLWESANINQIIHKV